MRAEMPKNVPDELALFPVAAPAADAAAAPLAHRLRPESFDDFLGHEKLLGPGKPLREAIEQGAISSMVLWGPPGCGKTTLARLLARYTDKDFVTFSAVTEGVPRVREIIREAEQRRQVEGRGTILFCDEIHRFNRAQQDAFLPSVEAGVITLVGATTENPSFELNSALLSRLRVFVLEPLAPEAIARDRRARAAAARQRERRRPAALERCDRAPRAPRRRRRAPRIERDRGRARPSRARQTPRRRP